MAGIKIGTFAAKVNLPQVFAERNCFVTMFRSGRQPAGGTDPEDAMATAGKLRRDLLRTLETKVEIENREDDYVVFLLWEQVR